MAEYPDVDLVRAATLMDLIQKQATVTPRLTHLSALAHSELLEMDQAAQAWADEVAKEKEAEKAEAAAVEAARVATEQAAAEEANRASAGRTAEAAQAKAIPATQFDKPDLTDPVATGSAGNPVRRA